MKSIPYKSNGLTLIHFNTALPGGFPHTEDLCDCKELVFLSHNSPFPFCIYSKPAEHIKVFMSSGSGPDSLYLA